MRYPLPSLSVLAQRFAAEKSPESKHPVKRNSHSRTAASLCLALVIAGGSILFASAASPSQASRSSVTPFSGQHIQLNYTTAIAGSPKSKVNPAVALASPDDKPDGVAPEHTEVSFGTAGTKIYVVPIQGKGKSAADFKKAYPTTVDAAAALQKMLSSKSSGGLKDIPFMPWADAAPAFEIKQKQVQFKSGKAIRFVTEYLIEPDVIDNARLLYVAQGLTADGKWYVSVQSPIKTSSLPQQTGVSKMSTKEYEKFSKTFPDYSKKVGAKLNALSDTKFDPNLDALDKLVESISVK